MALNRFMHPRNIYKQPPDFSKLAKLYSEFSKIAKVDVTGKVSIDFKDPLSLRVLTKCLLKSDFKLDVDIPEDRLVPTLPLRLNYILWIEDLLTAIQRIKNVRGLDIGTGACAIYPLLGAVSNKWRMVGTETDQDSCMKASENVQRNNLGELIELRKNPTTSVIEYLFTDDNKQQFDFCMCNPPFYSNVEELCESRSSARPPPKNCFTGSPHELITEGGELEFCRKLIKESKEHRNNVVLYTTMVGHKYNMEELIQDLKAEGINYTHAEFCQGRVTRWGLAWTYQDYDIYKLVTPREKPRKKNLSMVYILPELPNCVYDFEVALNKIKGILHVLSINYKVIQKRGNNISLDILAKTNTWSNQRRKRRLLKRIDSSDAKKTKNNNSIEDGIEIVKKDSLRIPIFDVDKVEPSVDKTTSNISNETSSNKCTEDNINNNVVVHAFLKVVKTENDILLQMEFLDGSAGKEGLHQIVQYIKNNWK